jgi:uncharacterized membrane protein HdeD (DUF308 family)
MKKHGWSIALSILMIVAGLGAIVIPLVAGIAITLVIGWLLIFSGIMHLIYCWYRHDVVGVMWEILVGIVYLIAGFYVIGHPVGGLTSLTLVLAFYLLARSILEVFLALALRGRMAIWLWLGAIINLILAAMIWKTWPVSSIWVIGTLIGFGMLFTGFTRLMLALESPRQQELK